MNDIKGMIIRNDIRVYELFNLRLYNKKIFKFFSLITNLGSTGSVVFFLLLSAYIEMVSDIAIGKYMFTTVLISQVIVHAIKRIVHRPRPYTVLEEFFIKTPLKCVYSFPSGHTAAAFAIGLVFALFFPPLKWLFLGLSYLVGLSRVVLGVHYPTDVLIGGTISFSAFLISSQIMPLAF